jgi:two-component system cell cycle response regulator DivK
MPTSASILLVEDSATYARLATFLLQGLGHRVTIADHAEAGLRIARDLRPDLILMDLNLPGMDGHRAVQLIREDPLLRAIPTVALTADRIESLPPGSGFTGFREKPIFEEAFRELLEAYLGPQGDAEG